MDNQPPVVSVVMSVYNGARYLVDAIESILAQEFADFELLLIDDASSDDSPQIINAYSARDPRIRPISNGENIGLTRSLNKGLTLARGMFLARLDADDLALPTRFGRQVAFLNTHPSIGLVGSGYELIDESNTIIGRVSPPETHVEINWRLLWDNPIGHSTVMFRRALMERYGLAYDESLRYAQDYDLWVRLATHTYLANIPDALVRYRTHTESITTAHRDQQVQTAMDISCHALQSHLPEVACSRLMLPYLRDWVRGTMIEAKLDTVTIRDFVRAMSNFIDRTSPDPMLTHSAQLRSLYQLLRHLLRSRLPIPAKMRYLYAMALADWYAVPACVLEHVSNRIRRRTPHDDLIQHPTDMQSS